MRRIFTVALLLVAFAIGSLGYQGAFAAASANATNKTTTKKSLYTRLGGMPAIKLVVDDFVGNVAGDKQINAFFVKDVKDPKRLNHFKKNLADFICVAAGGPCKYTGKDMKTAHAGMGITHAQFVALVEDLQKTLNKFKVGAQEQKELLGALGPLEPQIVENHGGTMMKKTGK